ncbi:MAG: ROK family protein [Kiritimatiellia bacterium]
MKETKPNLADYIGRRMNLKDWSSSLPLLRLLDESGPLTQPEAAKRLGLSAGACNLHFQRLEHERLIHRSEQVVSGRGRPSGVWDVNHARNVCITLVFDVPFFQGALLDFSGKVLIEIREDLSELETRSAVIRRMDRFLNRANKVAESRGARIHQVVAAMPGILESGTGKVLSAVNFPQLNGLDLHKRIPERFGWPCQSTPHGLAFFYGETEHVSSETRVMVVYWDLGIGVIAGRGNELFRIGVPSGQGDPCFAELGHIRIGREPGLCHCGRRGCLEAHVGGWAMLRDLNDPKIATLSGLIDALTTGDKKAVAVLNTAARILGEELIWPLQLAGVERICLTGPLAPVLSMAKAAFCDGLAKGFEGAELERLRPAISEDPAAAMRRGAFLQAKRAFLYSR